MDILAYTKDIYLNRILEKLPYFEFLQMNLVFYKIIAIRISSKMFIWSETNLLMNKYI